jgi:hypothetical protein
MWPIDLEALRREAQSSPRGESYTQLQSNDHYRVGIETIITQQVAKYFIEIIVTLGA